MAMPGAVLPIAAAVLTLLAAAVPLEAAPWRIMPMGDSVTEGEGWPGGYRGPLLAKLAEAGYEVDFVGGQTTNAADGMTDPEHEGHGGSNTEQVRQRVGDSLLERTPDVVLLLTRNPDSAQFKSQLDSLLNDINFRGQARRLLIATVPQTTDEVQNRAAAQMNAVIRSLPLRWKAGPESPRMEIYAVDLEKAIDPSQHLVDWIHPNEQGYRLMADAWFEALVDALPAKSRSAENPWPDESPDAIIAEDLAELPPEEAAQIIEPDPLPKIIVGVAVAALMAVGAILVLRSLASGR